MQNNSPQQELIHEYSIRISNRSKYMRLSVSLEKGIVVVIPKAMNHYLTRRHNKKLIAEFVQEKQQWISHALKKLQKQQPLKSKTEQCQLPQVISLAAIKQIFSITYEHKTDQLLELFYPHDYQLKITGDLEHKQSVFSLLEDFFKPYARYYLQQRLEQLSQQYGLSYNRLTVRAQKTRWGSCSSKKNINLNYRLLFIEQKYMDYVLLHELVHTVHMNHSTAYWSFFESLNPQLRKLDKQLRQQTKELPCWMRL